jgi:hypothetical protein
MKTTTTEPTHRAYVVTKRGDKSCWREIDAACAHADGEGLGLMLDFLPLNSVEIVIRTQKEAEGLEGWGGGLSS